MKTRYRNAVVTGASSGIGAEMAKYLARNRCHVLAVARNRDNLQKVKSSLTSKHQNYFHIKEADINKDTMHRVIVDAALKRGSIDLFISNAGVGVSKSFFEMGGKDIERVVDTNLLSPIKLTKKIIDARLVTKKHTHLQLVFVTSLAGKMGFPDLSTYSASKFGMEGFVEALRHDLKSANISICVLRPGVTDTGFFKSAGMEGFYESVKGKSVLHPPESVADELFERLAPELEEMTIGTDKYVVKVLPFFNWRNRLKVLDIVNKF